MAYDKVYAIAKAGSAKQSVVLHFAEIKEEIKATFSEEELEDFGDLVLNIIVKLKKLLLET